jgi:hypothetical protein
MWHLLGDSKYAYRVLVGILKKGGLLEDKCIKYEAYSKIKLQLVGKKNALA